MLSRFPRTTKSQEKSTYADVVALSANRDNAAATRSDENIMLQVFKPMQTMLMQKMQRPAEAKASSYERAN
jgi:hypothetical protein